MVDARLVWDKIFGRRVNSFTVEGQVYTVNLTEEGWECTCKDWVHRNGSYVAQLDGPEFDACKHIIKVIEEELEHKPKYHIFSHRRK